MVRMDFSKSIDNRTYERKVGLLSNGKVNITS